MKAKPYIQGDLVLAVDFDGTITTCPDMNVYPLELQPEVDRVLKRLYNDGVRLQLWTCRTGKALDEAIEFLQHKGLLEVFETINDQLDDIKTKYAPDVARKLGADFYIDDKNIMSKIDWLAIEEFIYGEVIAS
jgi:hypothetical protein